MEINKVLLSPTNTVRLKEYQGQLIWNRFQSIFFLARFAQSFKYNFWVLKYISCPTNYTILKSENKNVFHLSIEIFIIYQPQLFIKNVFCKILYNKLPMLYVDQI